MQARTLIAGILLVAGPVPWARADADGTPDPPLASEQRPAAQPQLAAPPKPQPQAPVAVVANLSMPPPAPAPAPAPAQPQTITLHLAAAPSAPQVAAPPPQPQTVTLQVVAAPTPVAPPATQTVTLQVVPTATAAPTAALPVAAQPAAVAEVRHAGPIGRMVGAVGECLAKKGWDTIKMPPAAADPVQQVSYQVVAQPAPPPVVRQVLASPQAPAKCRVFRR